MILLFSKRLTSVDEELMLNVFYGNIWLPQIRISVVLDAFVRVHFVGCSGLITWSDDNEIEIQIHQSLRLCRKPTAHK